ncbi:MAG TPA: SCO family protein [Solirubrobacteraceae bacterium]|jgi:protein SCO1/2
MSSTPADPPATEDEPQPAPDKAPPPGGDRSRLKVLLPLAAIAAAILIATLAIAAGSGKEALPNNVKRTKSAAFDGATVSPVVAAPPIDLRNSLGQRVTLSQYRGKVVLVTFLYTHCPDVCPLIASNLRLVETRLGADAKNVAVISVSVDPHGDTPKTVAAFLHTHDMTGRMQYLIGSASQLGRTWKAWNVGSQQDSSDPTLVAHSALVYGISASGKLMTLYPANFKPTDVVHDIRRLAVS